MGKSCLEKGKATLSVWSFEKHFVLEHVVTHSWQPSSSSVSSLDSSQLLF